MALSVAPNRVSDGVFMSLRTMCLEDVERWESDTSQNVLLISNWLDVPRIDAETNSASVIRYHAFRKRSNVSFIGKTMCLHGFSIEPKRSVALSSNSADP